MKKKILIFTLIFMLSNMFSIFCVSAASTTTASQTGINGNKYSDSILKLMSLGIIDGYPDGNYHADDKITRAQFAKLMVVSLGLKDAAKAAASSQQKPFNDVSTDHWAAGYVSVAYQQGIVKGCGGGKFDPDANATYEQVVTMLVRSLGYSTKDTPYPSGYLAIAAQEKITDNTDGVAGKPADRALVAKLLDNSLEVPWSQSNVMGNANVGNEANSSITTNNFLNKGLHLTKLNPNDNPATVRESTDVSNDLGPDSIKLTDGRIFKVVPPIETYDLLGLDIKGWENDGTIYISEKLTPEGCVYKGDIKAQGNKICLVSNNSTYDLIGTGFIGFVDKVNRSSDFLTALGNDTANGKVILTADGSICRAYVKKITTPAAITTPEAITTPKAITTTTTSQDTSSSYTPSTVATPTITTGNYSDQVLTVTLNCATGGSTINYTYTVNGSEPADLTTTHSSITPGSSIPITVPPGSTLKIHAMAVKSGMYNSPVYSFSFNIPMQVTADTGIYDSQTNSQPVYLYCDPQGSTIYYTSTVDGSEPADPTTTSSSITPGAVIPISAQPGSTVKIHAMAVKSGMDNSPVYSFSFNIPMKVTADTDSYDSLANSQPVHLYCSTQGSTIYYTFTVDGSEPADPTTTSSSITPGGIIPIPTQRGSTVKIHAMAVKNGIDNSPVYSFSFTIPAIVATPSALSLISMGSDNIIINDIDLFEATSMTAISGNALSVTVTTSGAETLSYTITGKGHLDDNGKYIVADDDIEGDAVIITVTVKEVGKLDWEEAFSINLTH